MLLNVIATSSVGSRSLQSENHLNPPPPPMVAPCSNFTSKDRVRSAMELQLFAHHFPRNSCIPNCLLLLSRVTRVPFLDYLAPSYVQLVCVFFSFGKYFYREIKAESIFHNKQHARMYIHYRSHYLALAGPGGVFRPPPWRIYAITPERLGIGRRNFQYLFLHQFYIF